jgi:oxysterol-binding protein-related protein 9/10/11
VCKPYNSVIGEHFRAHWDAVPVSYPEGNRLQPPVQHLYLAPAAAESVYSTTDASERASIKSGSSALSRKPGSQKSHNGAVSRESGTGTPTPSTPATSALEEIEAELTQLSLDPNAASKILPEAERQKLKGLPGNASASSVQLIEEDSPTSSPKPNAEPARLRTAYLTEQISHHPPVSAYHAICPARHISMCGIDQISAKVSGTTVRVAPGSYNKGIFVYLEDRLSPEGEKERYHITHPPAHVNGILRGSFYITVGDSSMISCSGGPGWVIPGGRDKGKKVGLRALIEYKEESWIGKANFALEGVIYTYDLGDNSDAYQSWTKVKHVPKERVVATLGGSWRHLVRYKLNPMFFPASASSPASSSSHLPVDEWIPLVDLSTLFPIPKLVRELAKQEEKESRRMWKDVTERLLSKEYTEANKFKHAIEQKQREEEADRRAKGEK